MTPIPHLRSTLSLSSVATPHLKSHCEAAQCDLGVTQGPQRTKSPHQACCSKGLELTSQRQRRRADVFSSCCVHAKLPVLTLGHRTALLSPLLGGRGYGCGWAAVARFCPALARMGTFHLPRVGIVSPPSFQVPEPTLVVPWESVRGHDGKHLGQVAFTLLQTGNVEGWQQVALLSHHSGSCLSRCESIWSPTERAGAGLPVDPVKLQL